MIYIYMKTYIDYVVNQTAGEFTGGAELRAIDSRANTNINEMVTELFRYKNQVHIYHWQTKSYARHKAADQLLDNLTDFIDKFMEIYFGKYGRVNYPTKSNITVGNMSDDEAVAFLNEMVNYFTFKLPLYVNASMDTDLLNIRDEILGGINQVKYLFTLN